MELPLKFIRGRALTEVFARERTECGLVHDTVIRDFMPTIIVIWYNLDLEMSGHQEYPTMRILVSQGYDE